MYQKVVLRSNTFNTELIFRKRLNMKSYIHFINITLLYMIFDPLVYVLFELIYRVSAEIPPNQ